MRVLITGGTGFIGSRLALHCMANGHTVRVIGLENTAAEAENHAFLTAQGIEVILESVTHEDRLAPLTHGIDIVYHLAAAQHEANVPDQHFWDVNVTGTRNLLEASVKAGVKRFVHGSTIGVYGASLVGTIDEQTAIQPDNIYGRSKFEGEKLVQSYQATLPVVIIRISETYGPGDRRLLKLYRAIQKRLFFMIGSGRNLHHPIYIDDLLDGLWLAGTVAEAAGQTFVLAGKDVLTSTDMVATIAEHLQVRIPKVRLPLSLFMALALGLELSLRPLGIQPPLHRRRLDFFKKSFTLSYEKASNLLGFMPQISFKTGTEATAMWYRDRGDLS